MTFAPAARHIAVIGGGPAGSAFALLLAQAGHDVILFESGTRPGGGWKIGEGLPPSASRVLQTLGVTERFSEGGHLPSYGNRSAWGSPEMSEYDFLFDPYGHGWHLDRERFDRMLLDAAEEAGASVRAGCTVVDAQRRAAGGWNVTLANGERITADVLADATGRKSWLGRRLGLQRQQTDGLVAVAALLRVPESGEDRDSFTMLEAVEEGWWYTALLPNRQRVVALMSDRDLPVVREAREIAGWLERFNRTHHLRRLLGRHAYELEEGPRLVAANSSRLQQAAGDDWLALGDAAAAYDPLSSQGILMALGTAIEAARYLLQAQWQGKPEGLADYNRFIDRTFDVYLETCRKFYHMEPRWQDAPFWQRRQIADTHR
jgi:flavin-dependent dehydrogenase